MWDTWFCERGQQGINKSTVWTLILLQVLDSPEILKFAGVHQIFITAGTYEDPFPSLGGIGHFINCRVLSIAFYAPAESGPGCTLQAWNRGSIEAMLGSCSCEVWVINTPRRRCCKQALPGLPTSMASKEASWMQAPGPFFNAALISSRSL